MWCDKGEEVPGHMNSVKINLGLLLISAHSSLLFDCFFLSFFLSLFLSPLASTSFLFSLSLSPLLWSSCNSSFLSQVLCFDQVVLCYFFLSHPLSHKQVIIDHWWNTSTTLQLCISLSHTSYNWSLMSMQVFKFYMMQRLVKWNSIVLLTLYV